MRKYSVLLLVLAAVLALNSLAFAEVGPDWWPPKPSEPNRELNKMHDPRPHDPERLVGKVSVKGNVGPYAAIFLKDTEIDLDWTGYEEEFSEGTAVFDIKANTKVGLKVEFKALSNGTDKIKTEVDVFQKKLTYGRWEDPWTRILDAEANRSYVGNDSRDYVQGKEHREYKMTVKGTLGDIHQQAEGDYSTTVTLTIYKK